MATKIYEDFRHIKYVKNYDGDTVTVNIANVPRILGEGISIRIRGIDTPEIKGKTDCEKSLAKSAQLFVAHSLKDSTQIDLVNTSRDKYFRILSNITYDTKDLSLALIANHLAVPYDGGTKENIDWCLKRDLFYKTPWYNDFISGETLNKEDLEL
jgi:endonuclease YncB( thermonuclease family)